MDKAKALKLAIQALEKEKQRLAVDANLHDHYGADYPPAIRAAEKRLEVIQAIEELRGTINGKELSK